MTGFFGMARDSGHEALGGETAKPLDVRIIQVDVPAGTKGDIVARCPAGYAVTGGGWKFDVSSDDSRPEVNIWKNCPTENGKGWVVDALCYDADFVVYAVCVKVDP